MNIPQAATVAVAEALMAYEPEATHATIESPSALLSVLAEMSRRALDAAGPVLATEAAAAERERLLHAPLDRFGFTIARYTEPGHSPEDRWDRGYQCAMRKIADLLQGNS